MEKIITEFPVTIYGNLETFNEVCSKARCRIFYKGANRNGTFITDEFAEKLVNSLHYVPVKGIYDGEDFTDHGALRSEGRVYGVVPETNNFAWETHLDEDGVEREYACTDVLLFTALYEEASEILGKPQSMELFAPSLQYHYEYIKGQKYVVFDNGCFLGLQALGDDVEPCFEGAAFYTLQQSIEEIIQKIEKYALDYQENLGGQETMPIINFKMSDNDKFNAIWSLLNAEYNEENNWTVSYSINAVYEDYALCFNYESGEYERVYYTKDDAEDTLVINKKIRCHVLDVTDSEKNTLDVLRALNGDTYELVSENIEAADENAEKVSEFSSKIVEMEETISTLTTEKDEISEQYNLVKEENASQAEELESLKNYKKDVETKEKQAVIAEYAEQLSEEIIQSYEEKIDEFSAIDLDKELAYELKKNNPDVFINKSPMFVPKDNSKFEGINAIIAKYVK